MRKGTKLYGSYLEQYKIVEHKIPKIIDVLFSNFTLDFENTTIKINPIKATIAGIAVAAPFVKLVNATPVYWLGTMS